MVRGRLGSPSKAVPAGTDRLRIPIRGLVLTSAGRSEDAVHGLCALGQDGLELLAVDRLGDRGAAVADKPGDLFKRDSGGGHELAVDGIRVTVTCRVVKIARQPYYRWLAQPVSEAEYEAAYRVDALFDAH